MEDVVTSEVESTISADSQPAEATVTEQTTENLQETTVDQSGEDVNTPTEDNKAEDLVQGAMNEVKAPRSQGRVQELANTLSQREKELEEARELLKQYQAPQQVTQGGQNDYLANEIKVMKAERVLEKDTLEFERAVMKHPELDKNSESYDPDFEALVWEEKKFKGIGYEEAANKLKKFRESVAQNAYREAEQKVGMKEAMSSKPITSTGNMADSRATALENAGKRVGSEGTIDALAEFLALQEE